MDTTLEGRDKLVSPMQLRNVSLPIEERLAGKDRLVSPAQLEKVASPI